MIDEQDPIHVLMRFADSVLQIADTIKEHHDILAKHGAVWIGKLGKPLGMGHVKTINRQVAAGHKTYLFLVQKAKGDYIVYRCEVLGMTGELPSKERKLVPSYYRNKSLSFWTKLSSIEMIKKQTLGEYRIASSGRPVVGTLLRSMAGMFVLNEGRADNPY